MSSPQPQCEICAIMQMAFCGTGLCQAVLSLQQSDYCAKWPIGSNCRLLQQEVLLLQGAMWFLPKGHIPQSLLAPPCQILMSTPCLDQWEEAQHSCSRSVQLPGFHQQAVCFVTEACLSSKQSRLTHRLMPDRMPACSHQGSQAVSTVHHVFDCCATALVHPASSITSF